jgi:hypothetical protein
MYDVPRAHDGGHLRWSKDGVLRRSPAAHPFGKLRTSAGALLRPHPLQSGMISRGDTPRAPRQEAAASCTSADLDSLTLESPTQGSTPTKPALNTRAVTGR